MTLDELIPGQIGRIETMEATGALGQRLLDLGLYPSVEVEVLRNAPLVDPIEIGLDGFALSLRHDEARLMEVILL